jgi:glycine oxidase
MHCPPRIRLWTATDNNPAVTNIISISGTTNVVIIGGGVIGLSIARALAMRGVRDINLFERAGLGTESSFAAAGMLLPQAAADTQDDFFTLACRSRDMYPSFAEELREETGIDIELDTTGTLYLAFTEQDRKEIERRYEWQSRAGLPVELFSDAEARELEPSIAPTLGVLRFPNDVQVENRRLLTALTNIITKRGVVSVTQTNVHSLIIEGNRLTGVQTSRGPVNCNTAVVAAGTWSSFIEHACSNANLTVQPVRGQMVCLESKPQLTRHVLYSPRCYIVPRRDGRLLAGSTEERVGFDKSVTAGGISSILQYAQEISGDVSSLPVIDTWAGLRPRTPDGLPVLGPCGEIEGLFYATGHHRNGILLAPLTGELISEAIVEGVVSPLLAPFSPNRPAIV